MGLRNWRARQRDANHDDLSAAFEALGCTVIDTAAMGNGFPDAVVLIRGEWVLVEFKTRTGRLSRMQQIFHERFRTAPVFIVSSVRDVMQVVHDVCPF